MRYRNGRTTLHLKHMLSGIYRHPVLSAVAISVTLLLICSVTLVFESEKSLGQAFFEMLPLLFGELGRIEEQTPLARLVSAVGLFAGVAFIAIVGASLVTWFVNFSYRGGRIMTRVRHKHHIIICGWNIQGNNIVNQLLSPDIARSRPVVILANLSRRPDVDDRVDFISGDPTKEDDLRRAGIMTADTVIILTEFSHDPENGVNPDAQAVLMTLAVETLRRDVYTCVQLFSSEYKKHLEHANVDEYICLDRLSGNLLVSSALNHGLSSVLSELLEFSGGSEFYKKKIPAHAAGMTFRDVAKRLMDEKIILIAAETEEDVQRYDEEGQPIFDSAGTPVMKKKERLIINPQEKEYPGDYRFKAGDSMFLIAVEEPTDQELKRIAT
ncbi:NAD-binding protein [bacterium]|nr:NAD-binding protein [bacterium]